MFMNHDPRMKQRVCNVPTLSMQPSPMMESVMTASVTRVGGR